MINLVPVLSLWLTSVSLSHSLQNQHTMPCSEQTSCVADFRGPFPLKLDIIHQFAIIAIPVPGGGEDSHSPRCFAPAFPWSAFHA